MTATSRLVIEINSEQARRNVTIITQELQRMNMAGNTTINTTVNVNNALNQQSRAMAAASNSARNLITMLGGMTVAYKAINAADEWTGLKNRLILVTDSQEQLNAAMSKTFDIAQKTGSSWENAALVYQRFAQNAKELGLNQERLAAITETVSKAVALSGGSAASANAALTQFGQALASGVLRGEEFNSVMEQAPGLAQALAKGLDVPVGKLRGLAMEGKITAAAMVTALEKVAPEVAKSFDKTAFTIGQNLTKLQNAFTKFIGENNGGSASALADGLGKVAENLDFIANTGAAVAIGYFTKAIIAGTAATGRATVASFERVQGLTAERAANIANAQAETVAAQAELRGIQINLTSAQSTRVQILAEIELEKTRLQAQITAQGRMATMTRMAQLGRIQAQVALEVAAAETAQAAATYRLKVAQDALTAATSRTAIAKAALMSLFSPMGIAIMATAAAFYFLGGSSDEVKESLATQADSVEALTKKYQELNAVQGMVEGIRLRGEIEQQEDAMESASSSISRYIYLQKELFKISGQDYENYKAAIESIEKGTRKTAVVLNEIGESKAFSQAQKDALVEYGSAMDESRKKIDNNKQATDLLNVATKGLVMATEQEYAQLKLKADSLNNLTKAYTDQHAAMIRQLQYQLEIARANGASESEIKRLNVTIAEFGKKAIDAAGAAAEFNKSAYIKDDVRKSIADQAFQTDKAKASMVTANTELVKLNAANQGVANSANQAANGIAGTGNAAADAASKVQGLSKAMQDYLNKTKEGLINNKVQLALMDKNGYTPAQASAVADAQTAVGFSDKKDKKGNLIANKLTQKQIDLILENVAVQNKLNASNQAYNDSIKAGEKATKDSQKSEDKAATERENKAKQLREAYDGLIYSMGEQNTLIGTTGETSKLVYRMMYGDLKYLSQAQKENLELTSRSLESRQKQFEFDTEKKSLIDQLALARTLNEESRETLELRQKYSSFNKDAQNELIIYSKRLSLINQFNQALGSTKTNEQQAFEATQKNLDAINYGLKNVTMSEVEYQNALKARQQIIGASTLPSYTPELSGAAAIGAGGNLSGGQGKMFEAIGAGVDLDQSYLDQKAKLAKQYAEKEGLEAEHQERLLLLNADYAAKRNLVELGVSEAEKVISLERIAGASALFGGLTSLTKTFAGEQSNAYKAMYVMQRAFTLTSVMLSNSKAIADAFANEPGTIWQKLGAAAIATAETGVLAAAVQSIAPPSFANGGYTGAGGKYETAGLVHKGEVVWSQDDIKRSGGVSNVEAMRKGSTASIGANITINNMAGVQVNAQEDAEGNITIEIVRREIASLSPKAVADSIRSSPNSVAHRAIRESFNVETKRQ